MTLVQGLVDLTICEGDIAQMEVKFSQENVEGKWMRNGQAILATDHIHMVTDKLTHRLLIEDAQGRDAGMYSFFVPAHYLTTSGKLTVQSKCECVGVFQKYIQLFYLFDFKYLIF